MPIGRRLSRGLLTVLVLSALCSPGHAAKVDIAVPRQCAGAPAPSSYPFVDRIGDIRFFPTPLIGSAEPRTLVQPKLGIEVAMASAAAIDRDRLLVATYKNMFIVDTRTGQLTLLSIDTSRVAPTRLVPTGVAIGRRSGSVFVANYLANNILVGRLAAETLKIDRIVSDRDVISPENVAVSDDEEWVVSANFDGNSVTAFKAEGGEFVHKWTTAVPLAHGVAILRDRVFVSSLTSRQIVLLNLADGSRIGAFGQPGWRAYCLDFLWPTGLTAVNDDLLVITDAHTGGVYRITFAGETGKLIDVSGGTAPGPLGLQMPYASTVIGDQLAILSTFSPKIVLAGAAADPRPLAVSKLVVERTQPGTAPLAGALPLGVGWNGYAHMADRTFEVSGIAMVPAYGALVSLSRTAPLQIDKTFYINPHSLGLLRGLMYFIEAHALPDAVVLSSPSISYALYVTTGRSSCMARVDLPAPPLATEEGLAHSFGTTAYQDVEKTARQRLYRADAARHPDEVLGTGELAQALETSETAVAGAIQSSEAKEAMAALDSCSRRQCSTAEREAVMSRFKASAMANPGLSFFELVLIDMRSHRCLA
jgi:hypothetical protein